jgi:hypothetical protein
MSMEKVSRYRKHAQDCRERERSAGSEEERALFRDLAAHWEAIADIHQRLKAPRRVRQG